MPSSTDGQQPPLHVVVMAAPSVHTERWCSYFRSLGWRVDWISYAYDHVEAVASIPQLNSRFSAVTLWRLMRESRRARKLLRELDPDLVHAHWFTGPVWIMSLAGERPFVATALGSDALLFAGTSRMRRRLARRVGRTAYAITHDSESIADALVALGVPRSRMRRIVFGADATLFAPRQPDPEYVRRLGITNDDPIVLSLRGLDPVYEPETVVRGFAKACRETPCNLLIRVDYVHIADESVRSSTESKWTRLRRLVSELDVEDRVIPYETVPREDLPRLLASCAAFVSVPHSDGTSVALLEALFCEAPAIVSDLPANREWVPDEEYGRIVPAGDADALARAIVGCLSDRDAAIEAARRAGERARRGGDALTEFERARDLSLEALDPVRAGL